MPDKKTNKTSGKKINQKMKPFLVYDYLLRESDKEHSKSATEIKAYLGADLEIDAERRSIYNDIKEINKALIVSNCYRNRKKDESPMTLWEAEQYLEDYPEDAPIVYNPNAKGFYINDTTLKFENVRLLAESVHASRFLSEKQSEELIKLLCSLVSKHQAEKINYDVLLTDRVKTNNSSTLLNVAVINEAMSDMLDGQKHTPEKISFKYLKYSLKEKGQVERKSENYVVSPYKLLINDGNYYLICFDDKSKKTRIYRIDRMKNVKRMGAPCEGKEEYKKIDIATYTKRTFGMFSGNPEHVTIQFIEPLLDTMIDRFGTKGVIYGRIDDKHYTLTTEIEISDQFFGWLCGFGRRVVLLSPESVVTKFKEHLDKMRELY